MLTGCGENGEATGSSACIDGLPEHGNSVDGNNHPHSEARIRLSPDGALLAGGGRHRPDLLVWETNTGKVKHRFEVGTVVRPVWLGASRLCWATDEAVVIADLDSGEVHHFGQESSDAQSGDVARPRVSDLVASPDGQRLAFIGSTHVVGAEPGSCSIDARHRFSGARSLGLLPDALVIHTLDETFTADPATGERAGVIATGRSFGPMVWSAEGTALAINADVGWSTETRVLAPDGTDLASSGMEMVGRPLAFSTDGGLLVGIDDEQHTLQVWEYGTSTISPVAPGQDVSDVALDAGGMLYVWGPEALDAFDSGTGEKVATFTE